MPVPRVSATPPVRAEVRETLGVEKGSEGEEKRERPRKDPGKRRKSREMLDAEESDVVMRSLPGDRTHVASVTAGDVRGY